MEGFTSNLKRIVVVLLLLAAATATATAQIPPKYLYGITRDGAMKWYRHNGATTGAGLESAGAWTGANDIGGSWSDAARVFPGGSNIIYVIKTDGTLEWRQHQGFRGGIEKWGETKQVGRGWGDFQQVFSGGGGIIYAITYDGKLLWYKHNGYLTGAGLGTPGAWEGPKEVGRGWADFKQVFPGGKGIIYAITPDGKLCWYKYNGYLTGAGLETPGAWEGMKEVGRGWADFKEVFSAGDGIIYAITVNGTLRWYKHNGYLTGAGLETSGAWLGSKDVGRGWADFVQVFALLPGSFPSDPSPKDSPSSESKFGDSFDKLKGSHTVPPNTIRVSVRYKKEFGYKGDQNAFGYVGPTSCDAFSVSVKVGDGSVPETGLIGIASDSIMEATGDYYVCKYFVSNIPLNQPVQLTVAVSALDLATPWKSGSQAQPPLGQQRTIIIVSGRPSTLMLTEAEPRATPLFEMVYAPR